MAQGDDVQHEFQRRSLISTLTKSRAFHGSDLFSRVGSGADDPTRPDPTREILKSS